MLQSCNFLKGVVFIFTDVFASLKENTVKYYNRFRDSKASMKILTFCIISAICVFISMGAVGTRFGYKVRYGNRVIATVGSKQQYVAAVSMVNDLVKGNGSEEAVRKLSYDPALVLKSEIADEDALAEAIILSNKKIVSAAALTVNGEVVAVSDEETIQQCLTERFGQYEVEGTSSTSRYLESVSMEKGYFYASKLCSVEELREKIAALTVETVRTEVVDTAIRFKTVQKKDNTKPLGYSAEAVPGQNGISRTTAQVTLVNGVETARTPLGTETVLNPVDRVVVVGTARSSASSAQAASSYGFIFPIPRSSARVSAYFGDGRNHKGVDICAPKGTPIYAVGAGTVTFSGYDGSYGYCIVIDHGNGLSTRYAHNNVNAVSVGQTVATGEVIATVGRSGNATGNHVHFEVIQGKTKLNPAPYIGL